MSEKLTTRVYWVLYYGAPYFEFVDDEPWFDSREEAEKYVDEFDWTNNDNYPKPIVVARYGEVDENKEYQ